MRCHLNAMKIFSVSYMILLAIFLTACGDGGDGGGAPSEAPVITKDSGWAVENIDQSFWTKWGYSNYATAYCNFWVYASDPDGIDDITYVKITNPEGTYWILRDSSTGKDHYDPEGGFFGGWERYYYDPHVVLLGQYSVLVRDSAGHEAVDSIDISSPGSFSGNGFIYSEDYTGSTDGGIEMLKRASVTNFTKGENNITIEFQVDDARIYNGYVAFYDDFAEYITKSDYFKNTINSDAGLYNDGTTNTLQIQSTDLELGSYTWDDIKGFHVVLTDSALYSPDEYWDHRSISQYKTFTVPTNVTATAGDGQVTISWDSVSGATSYNIYWSTSSGVTIGTGTKISNVTSPYTHTDLTNDTTYYYIITAENTYGESGESSEVSATPSRALNWYEVSSMPQGRAYLGVGVIENKIYAMGGATGVSEYTDIVEEYNPLMDEWVQKRSMLTPRAAFGAGVVNDQIYALGGSNSAGLVSSVEKYNPITDNWETVTEIQTLRDYLAVAVVDNKIYTIGGIDSAENATSIVEVYDPLVDEWSTKSPMNYIRSSFDVGVIDGKIYAFGGSYQTIEGPWHGWDTLEVYDPSTDTWGIKSSAPDSTSAFGVGIIDAKVYVIGGREDIMVYNSLTDKWSIESNSLLTVRGYLGVCTLNDEIFAIGGRTGNTWLAVVEVGVLE